jgi:glycine betaine catabolism B
MIVTYEKSEEIAPNIHSFYFKSAEPVRFTAGQFIEITLPHKNTDNRGNKRWFTISSAPEDPLLSITTKIFADKSTFKHTLANLSKGTEVHMSEPMGDFVLPKDTEIPLLFVAAGIGITPYHSILKHIHQTGVHRSVKLMYAVANEDDIVFQDTFDNANIHATIMIQNPSSAWGGERGTITARHILKITEPALHTLIYLAGPEQMVEKLSEDLHALGIPKTQLVTDFFPGYTEI